MAVKAKRKVVEQTEEEIFEDLEEISEEEEVPDLEELEEEEEELEEEEEEEEAPPRKPKKAATKTRPNPDDPKQVIQTVLVEGILAYIDNAIEERLAGREEQAPRASKAVQAGVARKAPQKAAKRTAAPVAKKAAGGKVATTTQVRNWLRKKGYEVSDRGRISEAAKKEFTKKTGYRIAA